MLRPDVPGARPRRPLDAVLVGTVIVLGLLTLTVALAPARARIGSNAVAETAVHTAIAVAIWLLAVIAMLRYRELRVAPLFYEAAAFVSLGLVYLYFDVIGLVSGGAPPEEHSSPGAHVAYSVGYLVFGLLLTVAGIVSGRGLQRIRSREWGVMMTGPVLVAVLIVIGLLRPDAWTSADRLPGGGVLETSPPWLIVMHLPIAAVFLVGSLLYRRLYQREGQPAHAAFSLALLIGVFTEIPFPLSTPVDYASGITLDEILRGLICPIVLAGVATQSARDLRRVVQAERDLARLQRVEIERQRLEDRERIAQDLHDGLAQSLWLAKATHDQLRARLPGEAEVRTLADAVDEALQDAIGETRKAIMAATDQPAGESSIGDALARDVAQFSARFDLPVTVSVEPVPRVDPDVQLELLRLTQEALRNVMKHANAGSASVVLRMRGAVAELAISDDGDGFDPTLVSAAAYGLTTMRRRAELIGGQLEIHSAPRRGTQVTVRFQPGGGIPDAAAPSRWPERLDERPLLSDRLVGG